MLLMLLIVYHLIFLFDCFIVIFDSNVSHIIMSCYCLLSLVRFIVFLYKGSFSLNGMTGFRFILVRFLLGLHRMSMGWGSAVLNVDVGVVVEMCVEYGVILMLMNLMHGL